MSNYWRQKEICGYGLQGTAKDTNDILENCKLFFIKGSMEDTLTMANCHEKKISMFSNQDLHCRL
jgi:hypothetical protein